jgi:hypothetical protein
MSYEQKDNTGSLWKNDRRTEETHAHARGQALIDGVEYWVDAFTNTVQSGEKAGQKYQSLKFKRKDAAKGAAPSKAPAKRVDDDIPF